VRDAGHDVPVVAAGGICSPWQAEEILARGDADIVASARQSLADPDWFEKIRLGRGADVRRCEFTNYCEGLDQMHKAVTCKLWDRKGLDDPETKKSPDGRRLVAPY
jgi:2,4-dienoyl-CoA reductase-like NADH-dependent reductase (Old Yellow Enzyme family)